MLFWSILALLTLVAVAFLVLPFLGRRRAAGLAGQASDVAIYRDQLSEIESDNASGLIDEREAEAARIEVSRRLLGAARRDEAETHDSDDGPGRRRVRIAMIAIIALAVPTLSAAFYQRLGSPKAARPGADLASQAAQRNRASIDDMILQVENHLKLKPDDLRSWEVLAPVYMRLGRYDDAVGAWRRVIELAGENSERRENYGESLVAAADGVVTPEAKTEFEKAVALDATTVPARYYLGLAALQEGRRDEARKAWSDLVASAPPEATWAISIRAAIDRLDGKSPPLPERPVNGPSARQMEEAARLPAEQQTEMIRGMVDKLAQRLKANGDDPVGWARLVQSYRVIGDTTKAEEAIADARKALAESAVKTALFEEALKSESHGASAPAAPAPAPAPPPAPAQGAEPQGDAIAGMVARLATRLKQNGDDPEGWVRLVRSYGVLGDAAARSAAIVDARKALAGDAGKLGRFEDGLKELESQPR